MNFEHVSVLLNECIEGLNIKSDGVYVDCTLGGGGHSSQIVKRLSDKGMLIGIDQDNNAIAAASERLNGQIMSLYPNMLPVWVVLKSFLSQMKYKLWKF